MKRIFKRLLGQRDVSKRAGLHVYRPLINAEKWAAWLTAAGVPNARGADQLRVTVFTATGAVNVVPDQSNVVVRTTSCVFASHGTTGLALVWFDYSFSDRHWALRELAGCEVSCCTSRAVLVLSDDIGDFDLTDEALLGAPANIVLDGEASEALDAVLVEVTKSGAAAAMHRPTPEEVDLSRSALLESLDRDDADPRAQAVLYDLSKGRAVAKSEVELVAEFDEEVDVAQVEKAQTKVVRKSDERRVCYAWASVSTVDGESVVDVQDDEIDTAALHDLVHLTIKSARVGAFEHDGEVRGEVVEGIVLDRDMQSALTTTCKHCQKAGPIDLGREGALVGIHYPRDEDWAELNDGDWEFSINATAIVEPRREV